MLSAYVNFRLSNCVYGIGDLCGFTTSHRFHDSIPFRYIHSVPNSVSIHAPRSEIFGRGFEIDSSLKWEISRLFIVQERLELRHFKEDSTFLLPQGPRYVGHGRDITGTLGINNVASTSISNEPNSRLSRPHVSWDALFPFGCDYDMFKEQEASSHISRSAVLDSYLRVRVHSAPESV